MVQIFFWRRGTNINTYIIEAYDRIPDSTVNFYRILATGIVLVFKRCGAALELK